GWMEGPEEGPDGFAGAVDRRERPIVLARVGQLAGPRILPPGRDEKVRGRRILDDVLRAAGGRGDCDQEAPGGDRYESDRLHACLPAAGSDRITRRASAAWPAASGLRPVLQVVDVDPPAGAVARRGAPRLGGDVDVAVAVHVADLELVAPEPPVEQDALGNPPLAEVLPRDPAGVVAPLGQQLLLLVDDDVGPAVAVQVGDRQRVERAVGEALRQVLLPP